MFIFYCCCLLFLPFYSTTLLAQWNKTQSSVLFLILIISVFSLIFPPLLALNVIVYVNALVLAWFLFAFIVLFLISLQIYTVKYYLKEHVKKQYFTLLKDQVKRQIVPFILTFALFLFILFTKIEFNDQFAYANASEGFRIGNSSFNRIGKAGSYYYITAGYWINSTLSCGLTLTMFNTLWTFIPMWMVVNCVNDFLVDLIKENNYKKYFIYGTIFLVILAVLSFTFVWAYGSGNTISQAIVLFLAVYLLKKYKSNFWYFLLTLYLIYFSPTGILLSVGLVIASFLYLLLFKPVKNWIYWFGYLFFVIGQCLFVKTNLSFIYILFSFVSLGYFVGTFLIIHHYPCEVFNYNLLGSVKKVQASNKSNWFWSYSNVNYVLLALAILSTVMVSVVYLVLIHSAEIWYGLNFTALFGNIVICLVLGYEFLVLKKYKETTNLLAFFMFATFVAAIIITSLFPINLSTWRISYLCIGYEVPVYWLGLVGLIFYNNLVNKLHWKKRNKLSPTSSSRLTIYSSSKSAVHGYSKVKYFSLITVALAFSVGFIAVGMSTYPLQISGNVVANKFLYDQQQLNEIRYLQQQIKTKTNVISDAALAPYDSYVVNEDAILTTNVHNTALIQAFGNSGAFDYIDSWKLNMWNFVQSAVYLNLNYILPKNLNWQQQEADLMYSPVLANFALNTFYGTKYIQNFLSIVNTANKKSNSAVQYLVFRSNSPYFSSYCHNGLITGLQNSGYKIIYGLNITPKKQKNLNDNTPYFLILKK